MLEFLRLARRDGTGSSSAAAFLVLELISPGTFMLWFGLSALLVGLISLFVAWPWQFQLVAFAVFASSRSRCGVVSRAASKVRLTSRSSTDGRTLSSAASSP